MSNNQLGNLFNYYGSDKDRNEYTPLYYTLFDNIKTNPLNVLEIGIGTMIPNVASSMVGYALPNYLPGGSLRAWRDYFVNSNIYGFDVQPDTQFSEERITTYLCNSTSKPDTQALMENLKIQFDIIIDDGCHAANSQINTLNNFYPYLKSGGIYIIEDIFPGSLVSSSPDIVKKCVNGDPLFFVGLKNNQCVIYKK